MRTWQIKFLRHTHTHTHTHPCNHTCKHIHTRAQIQPCVCVFPPCRVQAREQQGRRPMSNGAPQILLRLLTSNWVGLFVVIDPMEDNPRYLCHHIYTGYNVIFKTCTGRLRGGPRMSESEKDVERVNRLYQCREVKYKYHRLSHWQQLLKPSLKWDGLHSNASVCSCDLMFPYRSLLELKTQYNALMDVTLVKIHYFTFKS